MVGAGRALHADAEPADQVLTEVEHRPARGRRDHLPHRELLDAPHERRRARLGRNDRPTRRPPAPTPESSKPTSRERASRVAERRRVERLALQYSPLDTSGPVEAFHDVSVATTSVRPSAYSISSWAATCGCSP